VFVVLDVFPNPVKKLVLSSPPVVAVPNPLVVPPVVVTFPNENPPVDVPVPNPDVPPVVVPVPNPPVVPVPPKVLVLFVVPVPNPDVPPVVVPVPNPPVVVPVPNPNVPPVVVEPKLKPVDDEAGGEQFAPNGTLEPDPKPEIAGRKQSFWLPPNKKLEDGALGFDVVKEKPPPPCCF